MAGCNWSDGDGSGELSTASPQDVSLMPSSLDRLSHSLIT